MRCTAWLLAISLAAVGCGSGAPSGPDAAPDATPGAALKIVINGIGSVQSTDGAIHCDSTCTVNVPFNTVLTLAEMPGTDGGGTRMVFNGWAGTCTGTGPCSFTVTDSAYIVDATFACPASTVFCT